MHLSIIRTVFIALCLLLAGAPWAADSAALAKDPVTGLTAEQAVALGDARFIQCYTETTRDDSTQGTCAACYAYTKLRRFVNDRALPARSAPQQEQIATARRLCAEIATAYVLVDEAGNGGGTMYRIADASAMIDVEEAVGKLILSMEHPRSNPRERANGEQMLRTLRDGVAALPPAFAEAPAMSRQWSDAVTRLQSALPALQTLLTDLPDAGALALARFARDASTGWTLDELRYPRLPVRGKTLTAFVPEGWHLIARASGPMNNDSLPDLAAVLERDTKTPGIQHTPRLLAVLFQQPTGGYTLSTQSNNVILCADEGGVLGDPFSPKDGLKINRGTLVVRHRGGSREQWDITARFRFQQGEWSLIGLTDLVHDRLTGASLEYDYNLLTGKMRVTTSDTNHHKVTKRVSWQTPGRRAITLARYRRWVDDEWPTLAVRK